MRNYTKPHMGTGGARRHKFIRRGPQSKSLSSVAPSRVAGLSTVIENYAVPRRDDSVRHRSDAITFMYGISSLSLILSCSSVADIHWLRSFQEEYPIVDRILLTEETRYDIPWYFIEFHTCMNYRVRLIYGKNLGNIR